MRIGIDLGGTKVRIGLIDEAGKLLQEHAEPSRANGSKDAIIEHLSSMISVCMSADVRLIGIGVPSIVDTSRGIVYDVANIPSWDEVPLKDILENRFGVPVQIDNDCNCFALGIRDTDACKGLEDIVCITLGTGVGSGLIINGHLYAGKNCCAGEIGSIPYLDKDYDFYCGSKYFEMMGTSGIQAGRQAHSGDPEAQRILSDFGHHVGKLLNMVTFAYDPQAVALGGSLAMAYGLFKNEMFRTMADFPYRSISAKRVVFVDTSPGLQLIGAVAKK